MEPWIPKARMEKWYYQKSPKYGDIFNRNNWRGIISLSIPGKVFCSITVKSNANFIWSFSNANITEACIEFQYSVINFDDLKKTSTGPLWKILELYGFQKKCINIVKAFYSDWKCCVRTKAGKTNWFSVETGVRQGCVLSPMLFGIAIDWVVRKYSDWNKLAHQMGR